MRGVRQAGAGLSARVAGGSDGGQHNRPHFHAYYQGQAAVFATDTLECLGGGLPISRRRLVEAWAEIHRDELHQDWALLQSGQPPVKIEPLR